MAAKDELSKSQGKYANDWPTIIYKKGVIALMFPLNAENVVSYCQLALIYIQ